MYRQEAEPAPTQVDLVRAHKQLGPAVVKFCRSHLGRRVGNGECWTLAERALVAAGGRTPLMSSMYVFGEEVAAAEAAPGDILQFYEAEFCDPSPTQLLGQESRITPLWWSLWRRAGN